MALLDWEEERDLFSLFEGSLREMFGHSHPKSSLRASKVTAPAIAGKCVAAIEHGECRHFGSDEVLELRTAAVLCNKACWPLASEIVFQEGRRTHAVVGFYLRGRR